MRHALAFLVLTAAAVAGVWTWLGSPALLMPSQLGRGEKLYCVSYTPFRGSQTPLDPSTMIPAAQIEDDLTRLSAVTDCIRTYSVDFGLDQIAGIAAKHGLKVMQGLWLSSSLEKSHYQIETAVALANKYPGTIRSVVVGNEVLLRGDMTATDLANTIRAIKARVHVPVTYADVWEFWLRNRDVANAVDFITIHILPYWEDFPIRAGVALPHIESIRRQVVAAFSGKEVLIGEVGWPSAGRMREGALPSPVNQTRVVQDVLALSKREKFNVNIIEAFDQPWKRALEGTVGGHWGLFDAATRAPKFAGAQAVSNHPLWIWQGVGGIIFTVIIFAVATSVRTKDTPPSLWLAVSMNALVGGILIGWTVETVPIESLGLGGWSRSLSLAAVAIAAPIVLSVATICGTPVPAFFRILGPKNERMQNPVATSAGVILIATMLLAFVVALALVFDPRYRDFPFAPLTAAVVPFVVHRFVVAQPKGTRPTAEIAGAVVLALSVIYILFNEGFANWQSLWLCATLAALSFSLARVRDAPG
ncbi:MAG: beta-(1-6) glucans synthase [Pseudolabrys sp.]|jgi:exo-beta-1,3-glucanase (GH17 family)